jgi:hypothetical protein
LSRELRESFELFRPAVVDRHVLALDIAGLFEALAKGAQPLGNILGRSGFEKADHRQRRLLRARRARPGGSRAAEQRDEFAPANARHGRACTGHPRLCSWPIKERHGCPDQVRA